MRARWGDKGVVDLAGLIGYYSLGGLPLSGACVSQHLGG